MRVLALLLLAACGSPDPIGETPTDRIAPTIALEALGDGELHVAVTLVADGSAYEIEGEDELVAILNGNVFTLVYDRFADTTVYMTTFYEAPVDDDVTVGLNRATEDDAPASVVSLPAELALTAPATAARGEDLVVSWAPAGEPEPIEVLVVGDCVEPYVATVDDAGTHTIPAGSLAGSGSCDAEIQVSRIREGIVDSSFGGGSIHARQLRSAPIAITP